MLGSIAASLLLFAGGCTRSRDLSAWFRSQVLGEKIQASGSSEVPPDVLASGPYLASTLALRAQQAADGQIIAAVSSSRFEQGTPQYFVLNKWAKLKPDRYVEQIQILDSERQTEVDNDVTQFQVDDFWTTRTNVSVFQTRALEPGTYWVRVLLNGKPMAEYPFRVTPKGTTGR